MTIGPKRTTTKTAQALSMKGAGYYSQRTRGAEDVTDNAADMLFDAVQALPEPLDGQPVRIADFGAADGGTSKKVPPNGGSPASKDHLTHDEPPCCCS